MLPQKCRYVNTIRPQNGLYVITYNSPDDCKEGNERERERERRRKRERKSILPGKIWNAFGAVRVINIMQKLWTLLYMWIFNGNIHCCIVIPFRIPFCISMYMNVGFFFKYSIFNLFSSFCLRISYQKMIWQKGEEEEEEKYSFI